MLSDYPIVAALPASDVGRARKFYEDTLGLKPNAAAGNEEALFACGDGTAFFVYRSSYAGTNQATAAAWRVPDIKSTVEHLRSKGVRFHEYDLPGLKTENGIAVQADGTKAAWFTDTEGNILAIDQLPA